MDFAIIQYGGTHFPSATPRKPIEQNSMKPSRSFFVTWSYCASPILNFDLSDFGFPSVSHSKTWTVPLYSMGVPNSHPLLLENQWTEFNETFRDSLLHDAIVHFSISDFDPSDFGVSHSKTWTLPFNSMGVPTSHLLLLENRWTKFHETFRASLLHEAIVHLLF